MTLQSNGVVKIDGDSTGAVKALKDVKEQSSSVAKQSSKTASSFEAVEKRLSDMNNPMKIVIASYKVLKATVSSYMEAHKKGAALMASMGDAKWAGIGQAKAIQEATGNLISIQDAALAMNKLMRGDFVLTQRQIETVGKASVEIGRNFGVAAGDMMKTLSSAIAGGETNGLRQYGIVIDEITASNKANAIAMEEHGRLASETEKKNEKSKLIVGEIEKRYKGINVKAQNILEIEQQYTNTKERQKAIVALYNDGLANSITTMKIGLTNLKENAMGLITGLGSLQSKEIEAIRKGSIAQMREADEMMKNNAAFLIRNIQIELQSSKIRLSTEKEVNEIANEKENIEAKARKAKADERLKDLKSQKKTIEAYIQILKTVGEVTSGMRHWKDAIANSTREETEKVNELAKSIKVAESIISNIEKKTSVFDLKSAGESASVLVESINKLTEGWQDTNNEIGEFIKKTTDSGTATEEVKNKASDLRETQLKRGTLLTEENNKLKIQIANMEEQVKAGTKLSFLDEAAYNYAKGRLEKNNGILKSLIMQIPLLARIAKGDTTSTGETKKTATVSAAQAEYIELMKVIKKGNLDVLEAIRESYGTLEPAILLKAIRDKHNKAIQEEKKWVAEFNKIQADLVKEAEASSKKMGDVYDRSYAAKEHEINEEHQLDLSHQAHEGRSLQYRIDQWTAYLNRMEALATKELARENLTETERERIMKGLEDATKRHNAALLFLTSEKYKKMTKKSDEAYDKEKEKLQRGLDTEFSLLDDGYRKQLRLARKHLEDVKKANAELVNDAKTTADETEEAKEREARAQKGLTDVLDKEKAKRKAILDSAKSDVLGYANDIVRGAGGAFFDAMNMSDKALKESQMSRAEIMKKALKETFEQIAREAFIRSLMETAYGLAGLAMGDPKASAHFAAAAAFAGISGTALAASKGISAPSEAEIARRKEKEAEKANKAAEVEGATSGGGRVFNIYWPAGVIMGNKDEIVKALREAEAEADRRGR